MCTTSAAGTPGNDCSTSRNLCRYNIGYNHRGHIVCCYNTVREPHRSPEGHILMEKKGARLFQQETGTPEHSWNIVELESRRQLRQKINELIGQSYNST